MATGPDGTHRNGARSSTGHVPAVPVTRPPGTAGKAIDISAVAIDRLADRAHSLGLSDRITAERHDLAETFPAGWFDLVSAHYLHTSFDARRVLRTAAQALSPDGRLLVVDQGSIALVVEPGPDTRLPSRWR